MESATTAGAACFLFTSCCWYACKSIAPSNALTSRSHPVMNTESFASRSSFRAVDRFDVAVRAKVAARLKAKSVAIRNVRLGAKPWIANNVFQD